MDKFKKDIAIRGLLNATWMKFRAMCKENRISANTGIKKLVGQAVREWEESCNSKK